MKRIAAIAIAAVALLGVAACGDDDDETTAAQPQDQAAPDAAGGPKVVFPSDCESGLEDEPASLVVTCADAGVQLEDIAWESWGSDLASGTGTAAVNNCKPNCAAGKVKDYPDAAVRLTGLKQCKRHELQYTHLALTFKGRVPPGYEGTIRERFPCV